MYAILGKANGIFKIDLHYYSTPHLTVRTLYCYGFMVHGFIHCARVGNFFDNIQHTVRTRKLWNMKTTFRLKL